jgi:hypothetical protein
MNIEILFGLEEIKKKPIRFKTIKAVYETLVVLVDPLYSPYFILSPPNFTVPLRIRNLPFRRVISGAAE